MSRNRVSLWFMAVSAAVTMLIMGGGTSFAAHPDIPLYTYEEVAEQLILDEVTGEPIPGAMMPVQFQNFTNPEADGYLAGMPYSPKQTCGNCHNGNEGLVANDGTDMAAAFGLDNPLVSYDQMNEETFHAHLGGNNLVDITGDESQPGKPWTQGVGMFGKW